MTAILALACSPAEDVVLNIHVDGQTAREVVVVCHNEVMTYPLDSEGNAVIVMDKYDAAYARVFYGMEFRWIYFERGDRADISFKGADFSGSFVFDGEKTDAVNYLNKVRLTALPDEDYALPFEEYLARIQDKEKDAVKLIKANGLSSCGDFEEIEEARIRYSYAAPLLMYPIGHKVMTSDMSYEPDEYYYEVIDSYLEDKGYLADLDEFMNFAVEAAHVLDPANRNLTDLYPKTVAQMRFIADRFKDVKVRSALLHYLAAAYVDRFGTDDIQDMENIYMSYVKDEALMADYDLKRDKWDFSKPGKPSPDFVAYDLEGRKWTLKDFRGKYVYIDMWATWCGPCKKEMPYFKELAESFKDAEIVFLGLSIDSDRSKWEDMLKKEEHAGVQLYLGLQSSFQKAYDIESIPRFLLIDKEGRVVSNDMSRPSDPETSERLNALQGIR